MYKLHFRELEKSSLSWLLLKMGSHRIEVKIVNSVGAGGDSDRCECCRPSEVVESEDIVTLLLSCSNKNLHARKERKKTLG
jgi:hypothetical protein